MLLDGDLYTSGWLITKRIWIDVCQPVKAARWDSFGLRMFLEKWKMHLLYHKRTFFGLLSVTLVMPGTCFKPSFAIDFLAFFSFRECTVTDDPAGMPDSPPSPVAASPSSESELLEASSTSAPFLFGGSSGSSSIRGFDILGWICKCSISYWCSGTDIEKPLELDTALAVQIVVSDKGSAIVRKDVLEVQKRPMTIPTIE